MHVLDLLIWVLSLPLIWPIIGKLSQGNFTEELGGLIGISIVLVYTIIYLIIFSVFDNNWSDLNLTWLSMPKLIW